MLLTNRRGAIVLIPVIVLVGDLLGVPIAEEALNSSYDKGVAGVTSLIAAWSLFQPRVDA
jgi:hypothetical protein